jgi:outer membrane receptor protein involved in Fe transport
LGARYSDYSEVDPETTWKALANWQVNDWARLRGGFNRATRAPNIGELFLNQQEVFTGGGNFSDACAIRSNAPFGAQAAIIPETGQVLDEDPSFNQPGDPPIALAPGQTTAGATSAYLICSELMGGYQSPAYTQFYENSNAPVPGGGGGFAWVVQEGNQFLESETADTWTFGAVFNSPSDNPWLSGLTASFDFYDVEIEDAIMLYSLDFAQFRCYGDTLVTTRAEAQAWVNDPASGCQLTPRESTSTGASLNTSISYDNAATISTSGMDIGVNWFGELEELFGITGGLGLSLQATILDSYETKQSPANYDVTTEWKGSLGPNLSGTNGGAYDYRLFGNISYIRDNWSVSLRWRHLPEVWSAGYASQQAIIKNNASCSAAGPGADCLILGYVPTTEIQTDSYNIFDFSFNYNINETLTLRGGITNLFDVDPPEVSSSQGRDPELGYDFTELGNTCADLGNPPGCLNPGSTSLYSLGGFNGGYYDTQGRRIFLGLKAQF